MFTDTRSKKHFCDIFDVRDFVEYFDVETIDFLAVCAMIAHTSEICKFTLNQKLLFQTQSNIDPSASQYMIVYSVNVQRASAPLSFHSETKNFTVHDLTWWR